MKKLVLVALGAAFSLGLAFGADMDMKKDGMMKDDMKKEIPMKDGMKKDDMKKDGMMKDKKSMPMEDKKDMM